MTNASLIFEIMASDPQRPDDPPAAPTLVLSVAVLGEKVGHRIGRKFTFIVATFLLAFVAIGCRPSAPASPEEVATMQEAEVDAALSCSTFTVWQLLN
jgi:hypothetical protein